MDDPFISSLAKELANIRRISRVFDVSLIPHHSAVASVDTTHGAISTVIVGHTSYRGVKNPA